MIQSLGRAVPSGWQVRWLNDQLIDMGPGESRNRTLRITVPGGIAPTYQGLSLKAGSTKGNLTWSTTLVINVSQEYNGSHIDITDPAHEWLPGESGNLSISFINLGTHDAEHLHEVESSTGACSFQVLNPDGGLLTSGSSETITVQVDVPSSAHLNDTCSVTLLATNVAESSALHSGTINLTISVVHVLRLDSPSEVMSLAPGESKTAIWVVSNDGSEDEEIYFESQSPAGVEVSAPETWLSVARGSSEQFQVSVSINESSNLVGSATFTLSAKSRFSQATASAGANLEIKAKSGFTFTGPADNRVQLLPDSNTTFTLMISSEGTVEQELSLGSSGLESYLSLSLTNSSANTTLPALGSLQLQVTLEADSNAELGDHLFDVILSSEGESRNLTLIVQIMPLSGVAISGSSDSLVVGSRSDVNSSIYVTNLGNSEDTFLIELDASEAGGSLSHSLSDSTITLTPGESGSIGLQLMRISDGPGDSVDLVFTATSVNEPLVSTSWNLSILEQRVGVSVVFLNTPNLVSPGQEFNGSMVLTNTGNAHDSYLIALSGMDCFIEAGVELAAGQSSQAIPFTCQAMEVSSSLLVSIDASVHSLSDPSADMNFEHPLELTSGYTAGTAVVDIVISETEMSMKYDSASSVSVTVTNNLNQVINVSMSEEGDDVGIIYASWTRTSDDAPSKNAQLGPGESVNFMLRLDSMTNDDSTGTITLVATSTFSGISIVDRSESLSISIVGPEQSPTGLALPFEYELDNQKGLTILAGGWVLSTLLILFIYMRAKSKKSRNDSFTGMDLLPPPLPAEEEPEIAVQVPPMPVATPGGLAEGEVRMDSERKVACPSCSMRLALPRGSEPPFRFTCPSCDSSIRVVL